MVIRLNIIMGVIIGMKKSAVHKREYFNKTWDASSSLKLFGGKNDIDKIREKIKGFKYD